MGNFLSSLVLYCVWNIIKYVEVNTIFYKIIVVFYSRKQIVCHEIFSLYIVLTVCTGVQTTLHTIVYYSVYCRDVVSVLYVLV